MSGLDYAMGNKDHPELDKELAKSLGIKPDYLMAIMAFESGLDPTIQNSIGATGLIQFMPSTAKDLGTTSDDLAKMSQLDYVYKYFKRHIGKLNSISDLYMVVLLPLAVGEDESFLLGEKGSNEVFYYNGKEPISYDIFYRQNAGLDINGDGIITKGEAAQRVVNIYNRNKK